MAQMKIVSEKYDLNDKSYEFKTQLNCYDSRTGCYKVPDGEKVITNDMLPRVRFCVSYNQLMNLKLDLIGVGIDDCPIDVLILQVFQEKVTPDDSNHSNGKTNGHSSASTARDLSPDGYKVGNDVYSHGAGDGAEDGSGGHWTGINISNYRSMTKILKSVTIMAPDQVTINCKYSFKVPTIFIFKFIFSTSSQVFVTSKCRKFSSHNFSHLFIADKNVGVPMSLASMSISPPSASKDINGVSYEDDTYSDIEFVVEKKCIKAHRLILSSKSSVFRTLFWSKSHTSGASVNSSSTSKSNQNSSQNVSNSMTRIEVPDISYRIFYLFIKSLYSGKVETDNLKDSLEILRLSHKYNIIDLKKAAIELIEELESDQEMGLNTILHPSNGY